MGFTWDLETPCPSQPGKSGVLEKGAKEQSIRRAETCELSVSERTARDSGNVRCSCVSYEVMSDRGLEGRPGPESSQAQRHLQRCHGRLVPVALAGPHVTKKRVRALSGLDRVSHARVCSDFLRRHTMPFIFKDPKDCMPLRGGGISGWAHMQA